ncbi:hypothetical protein [Acinetobacter sp. NBRC 100985]|uniref:hypothetical protein n=1 Tax=Acinetobacter sp. NBRC 100985 TaxID=1071390 RepID=UPI000235FC90|nr:hypothetical protein [Acinetobacter sp. NBRC 100985]GAB03225.1 hypothetical protein ACT4_053_00250 [Acinetobacter sp. NBRC 100985]
MSTVMSVELTTSQDTRQKFIILVNSIREKINSINNKDVENSPNLSTKEVEGVLRYKKSISNTLEKNFVPFFYDEDKSDFKINYKFHNKNIIDELEKIDNELLIGKLDTKLFDQLSLVDTELNRLYQTYTMEIKFYEIAQNANRTVNDKIELTFDGIERAKLAFENDQITTTYKRTYKKLEIDADILQNKFYWSIGIGSVCAILIIYCKPIQPEGLNYWFLKFLIFTLTITLSTYFLRRSVHLRKQADQLKKEAWEMDALPIFIASLDKSVRDEVIKDLVPKYFAKELDQSINDKMADIVNEQIRTSLEVFKTGTEIVKSMKPSAVKQEDGTKKE